MTPEDAEDRLARHVESLYRDYGVLDKEQGRLDVLLQAQTRELANLNAALREQSKTTAQMLKEVGEECERNSKRVAVEVDKLAERVEARRWTPMALAPIYAPFIAGAFTIAAVLIKGG